VVNGARNRALTYALLSAFSSEGGDYLDAFWPFLLRVFPSRGRISCHSLQDHLATEFELKVPINVIRVIAERARSNGLLETGSRQGTYGLTDAGLGELDDLETTREVERRLNALLDDAHDYLEAHGEVLTRERIRNLFLSYIDEHNTELFDLLNGNPETDWSSPDSSVAIERLFVKYMLEVEARSPDHYRTLQDILLGSVVRCSMSLDGLLEMEKGGAALSGVAVYFDTNYLVGLLDLGFSDIGVPAKELYDLLVQEGASIRVFSFTLDELRRLLVDYIRQRDFYVPGVRVNDVYSSLRIKGWTDVKTREYIANLETTIEDLGIIIDDKPDIDLDSYMPHDTTVVEVVHTYKPYQNETGRAHDVAAIEMIRKARTRRPSRLSLAEALFVSCDVKLSRASYIGLGHKKGGTIAEVIQDRLLTSIIWLRSPTSKPPLSTVVASLSRNLFVKKRVWQKFVAVLAEIGCTDGIDTTLVATLLYHGYLERVLETVPENKANDLDKESVLEMIDQAAQQHDLEELKAEDEEKELAAAELKAAIRETETRASDRFTQVLATPRQRLHQRCARRIQVLYALLGVVFLAAIVSLAFAIWTGLSKTKLEDAYAFLIAVILGLLALTGIPKFLAKEANHLKSIFTGWCFRRQLRLLGLPDYTAQAGDAEDSL